MPLFLFISFISYILHPFAEVPLLYPHCSLLGRVSPGLPRPELTPAVQQANTLLKLLRTLKRRTLLSYAAP